MVAFEIETLWLQIHWYGIFYLITFVFWFLFLKFIARQKYFSKEKNLQNLLDKGLEDLAIAIILWVLVGWRLGYTFIYNFEYYINNLVEVLYFREWGLSFVGGVLGVIIWIYIIKQKYKISFRQLLMLSDFVIIVASLGIMLGRIGNFLNQELYWRPVENIINWNLLQYKEALEAIKLFYVYESVDDKLRLNTNFLESFFEGFIFFVVFVYLFFKKYIHYIIKPWMFVGVFLAGYWVVRFLVEFLRDYGENEYILFFTITQWIMMVFFVGWLYFIFRKDF